MEELIITFGGYLMEQYKLYDAEFKFVSIIWEEEPLTSRQLVELCNERLGWKKSTTYTVLRKLCERGVLQNEKSIVTSLVKKEETQRYESQSIIEKAFDGSLPQFITAFLGDNKLTAKEAEELKRLIDNHKEG